MSFINDLRDGSDYEDKVMKSLNSIYPYLKLKKNPSKVGIDLVSPIGLTVEVKFDRMMETTGNIFIEFECNSKPSGIFKYDGLNLFIYGNQNRFYLFNGIALKSIVNELIQSKKYKIISGGDGWKSKGVLIPEKELKTIALRKFYFN